MSRIKKLREILDSIVQIEDPVHTWNRIGVGEMGNQYECLKCGKRVIQADHPDELFSKCEGKR